MKQETTENEESYIETISSQKENTKDISKIIALYDNEKLKKKIKSDFHKCIKQTLEKRLSTITKQKLKKLSHRFLSNTEPKKNKPLLNLTIGQIYSLDKSTARTNTNLIKTGMTDLSFATLIEMPYMTTYHHYITSTSFKELIENLKKKKGDYYTEKYELIAINYIKLISI